MTRREPTEQTVTDGTRHLGTITPRAGGFEVFDADGHYLFKLPTQAEARAKLIERAKAPSAA